MSDLLIFIGEFQPVNRDDAQLLLDKLTKSLSDEEKRVFELKVTKNLSAFNNDADKFLVVIIMNDSTNTSNQR